MRFLFRINSRRVVLGVVFVVLCIPGLLRADDTITLQLSTPIPLDKENYSFTCTGKVGELCQMNQLGQYIGAVYQFGVGLAVLLSILMIMVGGALWLLSAGNDGRIGTAKDIIISALTGLGLALFSYVLLFTINPELVQLKALDAGRIASVALPEPAERKCCYEARNGLDVPLYISSSFSCPEYNTNYRDAPLGVCETTAAQNLMGCCQIQAFFPGPVTDRYYCFVGKTKQQCSQELEEIKREQLDSLIDYFTYHVEDFKVSWWPNELNNSQTSYICVEKTGFGSGEICDYPPIR